MTSTTIEAYVHKVGRELTGPRRLRREILGEVADGLQDAVEAHERRGLAPHEATRRALRESGDPKVLAREFREVLAAAQGRRTGALFALSTIASILAWDVIWRLPGAPRGDPGSLARLCYHLIDLSGIAAAVAAISCLGLLTLSARRGWRRQRLVKVQAYVCAVSVLTTAISSVLGNVLANGYGEVFRGATPIIVLGSGSIAMMCWQLTSCWRSLRVAAIV